MAEITVKATYKNGALQLADKLDLPEETEVIVTVTRPIDKDRIPPNFEAEVAAFERLKPELLKQYPGQAVAIYQGKVIAVGPDKMTVLGEVYEQYGEIHCFVEQVVETTPRRVRIPSVWISHQ